MITNNDISSAYDEALESAIDVSIVEYMIDCLNGESSTERQDTLELVLDWLYENNKDL
jgi:hypothetical protein